MIDTSMNICQHDKTSRSDRSCRTSFPVKRWADAKLDLSAMRWSKQPSVDGSSMIAVHSSAQRARPAPRLITLVGQPQ
jgi:hypothetical protein